MTAISIVIPLYNKAAYIKRALASVYAQTFTDYEVVIVDDGSTDDGPELVRRESDPRVRLLAQPNGGVSAARNTGIAAARGELVAFLDADDAWEPHYLATIMALRKRFPQAGVFGTAYTVEGTDGALTTPAFPGAPTDPNGGIMPRFLYTSYLWTSALAVRRTAFDEVGTFTLGVRRGQDLDMWVRLALRYPVAWSPKVCAIYHTADAAANTRDKLYVGDASFAWVCTEAKGDLYELLCAQRLRSYVPGSYLAGHRAHARALVQACRFTETERKYYQFANALTMLPVWLGRLVYRVVMRDWRPWKFFAVGNLDAPAHFDNPDTPAATVTSRGGHE